MPYNMSNNAMIQHNYAIYVNPHGKRELDPRFQPGPYDVICARGKTAHNHEGNRRFRELIRLHQAEYSGASTKYRKSQIVSYITNVVRAASPQGGFVKLIKGVWFEVGDRTAKEKIGQTFRDMLHTQYSSSTKAKARARIEKRIQDEKEAPRSGQFTNGALHDDGRHSASVVSDEPIDFEPIPSPIGITIETKETLPNESSGESLLEALKGFNFESNSTSEYDLEPLPLEAAISIELDDSFRLENFF